MSSLEESIKVLIKNMLKEENLDIVKTQYGFNILYEGFHISSRCGYNITSSDSSKRWHQLDVDTLIVHSTFKTIEVINKKCEELWKTSSNNPNNTIVNKLSKYIARKENQND